MLNGAFGSKRNNSLMGEYATLLGNAVLRNRAHTAEQMARIESELAGKVKSEFIANMSHELRTPLNTVMGFSKLLAGHGRRKLPDAEIVEYADLIHDAASHLLAVINDILDISKMQSGRYTLDAREISVEEILQSTVSSFRKSAEEVGVSFMLRVSIDLPPVRGDAIKLRQIMSNLVSNAIKFTRPGGSVAVEALRGHDGSVTILIRDTGVGMTDEQLQIALTPFGQVDGSRTRWREGTGLGLPIAKALVELHGGRLEIRSTLDVGTEVAVILPSRHSVTAPDAATIESNDDQLNRTWS